MLTPDAIRKGTILDLRLVNERFNIGRKCGDQILIRLTLTYTCIVDSKSTGLVYLKQ